MTKRLQELIEFERGFGGLRFGSGVGEVEHVLGNPDEVEFVDPETKTAGLWYYKPLKLHICFHDFPVGAGPVKYLPLRAVSFMTGSQSAVLWETRIVGLEKSELFRWFEEHDCFCFVNCPDSLVGSGYETFRDDSRRITLDLHNGRLKRIQWGFVDARRTTA